MLIAKDLDAVTHVAQAVLL